MSNLALIAKTQSLTNFFKALNLSFINFFMS